MIPTPPHSTHAPTRPRTRASTYPRVRTPTHPPTHQPTPLSHLTSPNPHPIPPPTHPPPLPPPPAGASLCLVRTTKALGASPGPRLQAALETLSADVVAVASSEVVQHCCDTVTAQGVVALVARPVIPLPAVLQTVLICDGIQDPGGYGYGCVLFL